ncbi:hypothetical protein MTO96_038365 [Rhipicephalus appendiculatus]
MAVSGNEMTVRLSMNEELPDLEKRLDGINPHVISELGPQQLRRRRPGKAVRTNQTLRRTPETVLRRQRAPAQPPAPVDVRRTAASGANRVLAGRNRQGGSRDRDRRCQSDSVARAGPALWSIVCAKCTLRSAAIVALSSSGSF